jgi:pyridoxal phosphate enzyme (YggS family)
MTHADADSYARRLERTLPTLLGRIDRAAAAVGRPPDAVRLVAVTKGHPLEAVDAALRAGLRDLGEKRLDELEEKAAACVDRGATWHMIGHVQSRKARRVTEVADLIHSIDSVKLAERLSLIGQEDGRIVAGLVQVNTSGERSKGGFPMEGAVEQVHRIAELPHLEVRGLMTMAPFTDDQRVLSSAFGGLRRVLEEARRATEAVGAELSMGMTNDMHIAIREGSTMVRIGTALFGERATG